MNIETPPCFFCQQETYSTFCHKCKSNNLIHVQTFEASPIVPFWQNEKNICRVCITCLIKGSRLKIYYMQTLQNQTEYTTICCHKDGRPSLLAKVPGYPLTPSNIMTKLPLYLTFS